MNKQQALEVLRRDFEIDFGYSTWSTREVAQRQADAYSLLLSRAYNVIEAYYRDDDTTHYAITYRNYHPYRWDADVEYRR